MADAIAATRATSDLLGRARVRRRWEKAVAGVRQFSEEPTDFLCFDEAGGIPLMQPTRALEYFRKLVPSIGVDPQRWGPAMERHAFTLAVDADGVILDKVKSVIAARLETGAGVASAPAEIEVILDSVGVTPRNPQYSEMVFRTNARDAYLTGADEERQDPDVVEFFPAWRYSAIVDTRSRRSHAERNGKYFPASLSFAEVRGTDIGEVANCRCDFILIDKDEWAQLQSKGVRFAIAA